uniref:Uncharacterized protein n=1 Tax=Anopheles maculatus TaxID=74869 RepID=A0A182SCF4_9DIPT
MVERLGNQPDHWHQVKKLRVWPTGRNVATSSVSLGSPSLRRYCCPRELDTVIILLIMFAVVSNILAGKVRQIATARDAADASLILDWGLQISLEDVPLLVPLF